MPLPISLPAGICFVPVIVNFALECHVGLPAGTGRMRTMWVSASNCWKYDAWHLDVKKIAICLLSN